MATDLDKTGLFSVTPSTNVGDPYDKRAGKGPLRTTSLQPLTSPARQRADTSDQSRASG